ncbi:flagellar motor protein MotB [Parvularcula oceani]|uniref:flagellar motor protein MotB n=1 Tax=Parvularcula oceani TaxID=1247963 RepID=UPI00068B1AEA|nr:flagellar motor protein MotB [Parvularcula oceani]
MSVQPIIVKRKKTIASEGHHGGAWKVAYADFVTAMMAFFLLMWLLNATTEEQRAGLADYFDPSVPISAISGGGMDMMSGDSVYATESLAHDGHGGAGDDYELRGEITRSVLGALKDVIDENQVKVTLTPEGTVVDLIDADGAPLFALGGSAPSDLLRDVVAKVTPVLAESGRRVKFVGHTDDIPFRKGAAYSNWELSADRANAARRLALAAGFPIAAISEVSGRADRQPVNGDASAAENRRISIIMLNESVSSGSVNSSVTP